MSVKGVVADNLSGVASLSADIDNGPAVAVSYDASGNFTFTTSLPLDGSERRAAYRVPGRPGLCRQCIHHDVCLHAQNHRSGRARVALDPAFEASGNDLQTNDSTVTLDGTTDPRVSVVLVGTGLSTTSDSAGKFQFTGVALKVGGNTFTATATDAAGNQSSSTQTITLLGASSGPVVSAALLDDTAPGGTTNSDGITSDPSVGGTVTDRSSTVTQLAAGFDSTPLSAFVSVLADLGTNGSYTLDRAEIVRIDGGAVLSDGTHVLHIIAGDLAGGKSPEFNLTFTLKTIPPAQPVFAGPGGPPERGTALHRHAPGDADRPDRRQHQPQDRRDRRDGPVDEHRHVPVPGVRWRWATTRSRVRRRTRPATPASSRRRSTATPSTGGVNQVIYWNQVALQAIENDASTPEYASRGLAMVSAAVVRRGQRHRRHARAITSR